MINQEERDIILNYAMHKISMQEINNLLPEYSGDENLKLRFWEVMEEKDSESLQYLDMLPKEDSKSYIQIRKQLLLESWHQLHEDIVGFFQLVYNDNIENINVLLEAISNLPEYLSPDDFKYPYIRKIIYAIGAQPEPCNILALERLAKTEDEQIRKLALHQIEKRKRLGRWESKKKTE